MLTNRLSAQEVSNCCNWRFVYREDGFTAHVLLDRNNELLWVDDYEVAAKNDFYSFLWKLARQNNLGKIIFAVRPYDLYLLKNEGFIWEGYVDGFFAGVPACFLAGYLQPGRSLSSSLAEEQRTLSKILTLRGESQNIPPAGTKIRQATKNDTGTCHLFLKSEPSGIVSTRRKGNLSLIAWQKEKPAGVVTAACDLKYKRAEIIHCAALPGFEEGDILRSLLASLVQKCQALGIKCIYALARASSSPINLALHNSGYLFRGTLINNCSVTGQFENAHIWVTS